MLHDVELSGRSEVAKIALKVLEVLVHGFHVINHVGFPRALVLALVAGEILQKKVNK